MRGDAVGAEQFPVVEQVGHDQRGEPPGARAAFADDGAVLVVLIAAMGQVGVAVVAVQVGEAGDAVCVEPVHETDQFGEPAVAGAHVVRGAVGPRQRRHRLVARSEQGHHELFGDQPPPGIADEGEGEPPVVKCQLDRQAHDLCEVPEVVLEDRTPYPVGQGEPGLTADIDAGEHRTGAAGGDCASAGGAHRVASSGRSGSSSSWSATSWEASASWVGLNRSRIWPIRWEYGPKTAMNWAWGTCCHCREKNAFNRRRLAAWRGANTASGQSRHIHGRAGQGLPFGPCSPDSWSAQAAVNTSCCPPTSSAITVSSSLSAAISCG